MALVAGPLPLRVPITVANTYSDAPAGLTLASGRYSAAFGVQTSRRPTCRAPYRGRDSRANEHQ